MEAEVEAEEEEEVETLYLLITQFSWRREPFGSKGGIVQGAPPFLLYTGSTKPCIFTLQRVSRSTKPSVFTNYRTVAENCDRSCD